MQECAYSADWCLSVPNGVSACLRVRTGVYGYLVVPVGS